MSKCRICAKEIKENENEVNPFRGGHYHESCYKDWLENRNNLYVGPRPPMFWKESLWDYLSKDLKMAVNWPKLTQQWSTLTKTPGYTPKGVYFAVRYIYDVQHSSIDKSLGGIGLVPNVYEESKTYWANLAKKQRDIPQQIKAQQEKRANRPVVKIRVLPEDKPKLYDLNSI